jgi:seryl-tRNA synthetase
MMSNVVSIFGEFENPKAKQYEKIINAEVKESLDHFQDLIENIIHEHYRSKNNERHIRSRTVITDGVVLHMSYVDLIEAMFEEYIIDFGMTKYIKGKKAYFYSRIIPFFDKTLKKYNHLIDMNQCLKQFNSV